TRSANPLPATQGVRPVPCPRSQVGGQRASRSTRLPLGQDACWSSPPIPHPVIATGRRGGMWTCSSAFEGADTLRIDHDLPVFDLADVRTRASDRRQRRIVRNGASFDTRRKEREPIERTVHNEVQKRFASELVDANFFGCVSKGGAPDV